MTLTKLAERYVNRVGGAPSYLRQMQILLRRLPWDICDLTPDRIDQYLTDALAHLAPSTVHRHRRMLGCLLRFAVAENLVDKSIVRPLRRVKVLPPQPVAWDHATIRRLVAIGSQLTRGTRHCKYDVLIPAWILVAYSTGLRTSDLLRIRHDAIRGNKLRIAQQKTAWPHVVVLDDNAMRAIRRLPIRGPRIFGDLISAEQIVRTMRRLVKRAGVRGSTKFLRRAGATYCEIAGQDASAYLGHKTPGMKAYYVDRLLLADERPDTPAAPALSLGDAENLERV